MLPSLRALIIKTLIPALTLLALSAPSFAGEDKTTICHIPPGDPDNVQIIEVSAKAAAKHLQRHGDRVYAPGEICDGIDNDCDRAVDEDFPELGVACSDGVGACLREGEKVCDPAGGDTVCSAVAGEPAAELCTGGIDEDCDGDVDCGDADCDSDPACKIPVCGDGAVDPGEQCDDPTNECCSASCQITAGAECAADDNECTLSQCSAAGVCEAQDTDGQDCSGNGVDQCSEADTCLSGACQDNGPAQAEEIECNGLDEDCDGVDLVPSGECATGLQGECAVGAQACVDNENGGQQAGCVAINTPKPEDCTTPLDEDCDGLAGSADPDCDGGETCATEDVCFSDVQCGDLAYCSGGCCVQVVF